MVPSCSPPWRESSLAERGDPLEIIVLEASGGLDFWREVPWAPTVCPIRSPKGPRSGCWATSSDSGLVASLASLYSFLMTIELPASVEKELRALAVTQSRDIDEILEEAVRLYIGAAAITDLHAAEVAETQIALVSELRGIEEWKDGHG